MKKIMFIFTFVASLIPVALAEDGKLSVEDNNYALGYIISNGINNPKILNSKAVDHKGFKNYFVSFEGDANRRFATTGEIAPRKVCGTFKFVDFDGKRTATSYSVIQCNTDN